MLPEGQAVMNGASCALTRAIRFVTFAFAVLAVAGSSWGKEFLDMPFYRYQCRNCGYEFRHLHLNGSEDHVTCPKCEGTDLERQLPRVAVQFKGSGYYKTDRANKKSKAGTGGLSEKETSTDTASKDKTESGDPSSNRSSKD
jgi:putative FmdB family regulatory protein